MTTARDVIADGIIRLPQVDFKIGGARAMHLLDVLAAAGFVVVPKEPLGGLLSFFRHFMEDGSWLGGDIDGGDAQDKAQALGLLDRVPFDPDIHGDGDGAEPGDPWFVYSDAIRDMTQLVVKDSLTSEPAWEGEPYKKPYAICRRCRQEFTEDEVNRMRLDARLWCGSVLCPMPDHNEEDGE